MYVINIPVFSSTQQLKEQLESQMNSNRERMTELQQDFDNLNEERIKLLDEIDDFKKRLQAAQQEKEAAQRKYHKEVLNWNLFSFRHPNLFLFSLKLRKGWLYKIIDMFSLFGKNCVPCEIILFQPSLISLGRSCM